MNELAFDLCQHTGPRGGVCAHPITRGLLLGEWFHRTLTAGWPMTSKVWDHPAEPSETPLLVLTQP